jgi:hypothetical protein
MEKAKRKYTKNIREELNNVNNNNSIQFLFIYVRPEQPWYQLRSYNE